MQWYFGVSCTLWSCHHFQPLFQNIFDDTLHSILNQSYISLSYSHKRCFFIYILFIIGTWKLNKLQPRFHTAMGAGGQANVSYSKIVLKFELIRLNTLDYYMDTTYYVNYGKLCQGKNFWQWRCQSQCPHWQQCCWQQWYWQQTPCYQVFNLEPLASAMVQ